jgi:hypothetical protein
MTSTISLQNTIKQIASRKASTIPTIHTLVLDTYLRISSIYNPSSLLEYVIGNPSQVHYCMVWSSWSAFNFTVVYTLIKRGILNPREINTCYDGDDAQNISFLDHCKLLQKELQNSDKYSIFNSNLYTLSTIINYIEKYVE